MSYVFSVLEKKRIFDAVSMCDGMVFDPEEEGYTAVAIESKNCAPFYQALSDIIGEKLSGRIILTDIVNRTLKSAKLWLDVAIDANGGNGAYSALIRAYTLRQGWLRLNKAFSEGQMQEASNGVAVNFVNALIHGSKIDDLAPWTVPSISQIASIDARAVGEILFRRISIEDTASSRNSGWSGTIAFSLLGGEFPYETWRLISAGDPGSEIKGSHDQAKVNKVDDFKNILFAINSYKLALQAVVNNFGQHILETLFSLPTQINVALSSGNINPLIQYVVKGTPISPTVNLILRYGVNAFFDMFRRTYEGGANFAATTDETFAVDAYAFFLALPPSQSQSIVAKTIGEYGSASEWGVLAAQDTSVGQALRNSLKHLSEIVIERDDGFSGRGLELHDSKTGEGVITEQWLIDRADMLGRLIARTHGSFGENTAQKFSYSDLASGKLVRGPVDVLPLAEISLVDGANGSGIEITSSADVTEQSGGGDNSNGAASTNNAAVDTPRLEGNSDALWGEEFLANIKKRRSAFILASGFVLNAQGAWSKSHMTDADYSYHEKTHSIVENYQAGSLSVTPDRLSLVTGRAVPSERSSNTTSRTESISSVVGGLKNTPKQEPQYYPSGSSFSGFALSAGEVVIENKSATGVIQGWYVYPAGSFESGAVSHKQFSWDVTTETIRHQVVQGDDAGGRVNVEGGNIFHGGMGDDFVVTYKDPDVYYGEYEGRTPGAFLSGGAGDDTLLGSEGADYLISGSGNDWLYGENGPDTYIIGAHAGATTVVTDMPNPVFVRPEVGGAEWEDEFGLNDTDTVRLPVGITLDQLQLSRGSVLIEAVNIELAPNPKRGTYHIPPRGQMLYSTLDISWGKEQQVRIVLPNATDLGGSGIEILKFADGSHISLEDLIINNKLGSAPDTYRHGVLIDNAVEAVSLRDGKKISLVGGQGNDTLSGAGEIRGMQGDDLISSDAGGGILWGGAGNDTLIGGAGNDIYKYDGLGRDLIINRFGGMDGIDFTDFDASIHQLKFHRDNNDLVIVVNYGSSPKIRVANHFTGGEAAISFIRVQGVNRVSEEYTADQLLEFLHPLPPLRDMEDILLRDDESMSEAIKEITEFYRIKI